MSVGSDKNRKETESMFAAGESEEVRYYLVTVGALWKETTQDGHCWRAVGKYDSVTEGLARELRRGSLNGQ
jgi:hypothetical protein